MWFTFRRSKATWRPSYSQQWKGKELTPFLCFPPFPNSNLGPFGAMVSFQQPLWAQIMWELRDSCETLCIVHSSHYSNQEAGAQKSEDTCQRSHGEPPASSEPESSPVATLLVSEKSTEAGPTADSAPADGCVAGAHYSGATCPYHRKGKVITSNNYILFLKLTLSSSDKG